MPKSYRCAGYKIVFRPCGSGVQGETCFDDGVITIDPQLAGKEKLTVLIHELLHSTNPDSSEERVLHDSRIVAETLWLLGYRHISEIK